MFATLLVIVVAGLAGPLIAAGPRPLIPAVVGEIAAGAVLARTGLGVIDPSTPANAFLYALGFAMLMLVAGSQVQLRAPALASGARSAAIAFAAVVVLAAPAGALIGAVVAPSAPVGLFSVLLAGSSAAVAFPILKERGLLAPRSPSSSPGYRRRSSWCSAPSSTFGRSEGTSEPSFWPRRWLRRRWRSTCWRHE